MSDIKTAIALLPLIKEIIGIVLKLVGWLKSEDGKQMVGMILDIILLFDDSEKTAETIARIKEILGIEDPTPENLPT